MSQREQARLGRAAMVALGAGFVILLFNSGSRFAIGLFLKPMAQELGSSRSGLSLAVTVFMVVSAVGLPVVGRLVDRFGAARVLGAAVLASAASLTLLAFARSRVDVLVLYGLLFAAGSAGTSVTTVGVLITRWFPQRAGLANSIAISGMGVGQILIVTALAAQLEHGGWRMGFAWLGAANLLCLAAVIALAVGAGAPPAPEGKRTAGAAPRLGELARSGQLWLLLAVYAVCGLQDFFVATHVVAFAQDEGVGAALAGNLLALMGLFGLVGVLLTGAVADRYGPSLPTAACFALRAALFWLVLVDRSTVGIALYALLYGATFWITAPLTVIFVRECFGMARLGVLTGTVIMVHQAAGGLGALVGAAFFDLEGSYDGAYVVMLAASVVALALTVVLRVKMGRASDAGPAPPAG